MKKNSLVLGAVLLALAVLFIGCEGLLNGEKATGSSGRKLIYTTANGDEAYDENGEEVEPEKGTYTAGNAHNYYRFYVQHGSGESCYGATQKITVDKIEDMGDSVVGFIFNLNSEVKRDTNGKIDYDEAGKKQYVDSFYLLGWKPSAGMVYLNRFTEMDRADLSGGADSGSMSNKYSYYDIKDEDWLMPPEDPKREWIQLNNTKPATSGSASAEFKFIQTKAKDTDTTYTVYVNKEPICTWKANIFSDVDQNKYDKGGLAAYANVYQNKSLTAEWEITDNEGYYSETAESVDMPL